MQIFVCCKINILMCLCMCTGLARTLFIEDRALFGPTIDLEAGACPPSTAHLAHIARGSGEFAVAFRGGRAFGLRMVPSASPTPRQSFIESPFSSIVSGGTKVLLLRQCFHGQCMVARVMILQSR